MKKQRIQQLYKKGKVLILLMFCGFCCSSFSIYAQDSTRINSKQELRIHGKVTDKWKNPLPGVTVRLSALNETAIPFTARITSAREKCGCIRIYRSRRVWRSREAPDGALPASERKVISPSEARLLIRWIYPCLVQAITSASRA